jgi:hypothetical protein
MISGCMTIAATGQKGQQQQYFYHQEDLAHKLPVQLATTRRFSPI